MNWLMRLFRRGTLERDLERELRFHIDAHARDLMSYGLTRAEAERRAQIELGGVEQVKESARDARGTRWLEDWWQDTRFGVRAMLREPVFTAAAVLTLALGIGANTAVWSIADSLMFRSLPIEEPRELHAIRKAGVENSSYLMSHRRFRELQSAVPDTVPIAAMSAQARAYATIADRPESVTMQLVSGEWFSLLGVPAELGRVINQSDDRSLGGHPVVVLSDGYWSQRFGRDRGVIGRVIRLNGSPLTVIGVARAGFQGLTIGQSVDVWTPMTMQHEVRYNSSYSSNDADTEKPWIPQPGIHWLTLVARVAPEYAAHFEPLLDRRFRSEVERDALQRTPADRERVLREHAVLESLERGFSPLRQFFGPPLRFLMIAVAMVLLISSANLAGLLLARTTARRQELAVRLALGARGGRLVRQLLTESTILALFGGALGLLVAHWGARALVRGASAGAQPIPLDVGLDAKMLGFTFGLSLLSGLLFGLAPTLSARRASLHDAFKTGGRVVGAKGASRLPLGRVLVASQIALSLVLVISAGLFVRTFQNLLSLDPGYAPEQVITARVDVRAAGLSHDQLAPFYQRLLESVRAVPGVRSASLSLYGHGSGGRRTSAFAVPGVELKSGEDVGQENFVTPDFFVTTGMQLLHGRAFTDADRDGGQEVAIVSEGFARHFFRKTDVVGQRFGYSSNAKFEVVGVVRDARMNSLLERPQRLVFYPLAQEPQEYISSVEARVARPASAVAAEIQRAIVAVDRNLPVREVIALRDLVNRGLWREGLLARIAGMFGVIALLLSGIGLYGVMAYLVTRRTNEIGVRLALGAKPAQVRWLVLRDSLVTIVAGITLGLVLAVPLVNLARGLLYGLSPRDPTTAAIAAGLTVLVGISAALVPAWRASRVDPQLAMRAD